MSSQQSQFSIAIVRMKSMDEGHGLTENEGYSAAGDAVM
jgi:hypothetical protein